jgi:hypothetical protein
VGCDLSGNRNDGWFLFHCDENHGLLAMPFDKSHAHTTGIL